MLNEKYFHEPLWKASLDAAGSVPAITAAEKEAMWDKLHVRIQPDRRPASMKWFRIAACILVMITLSLFIRQEKAPITKSTSAGQQNMVTTAPPSHAPNTKTVFLLPAAGIKPGISKENKLVTTQVFKILPADTNDAVYIPTQNQPDTLQVLTGKFPVADSMASPAIVQKKMVVVHINELETVPASFAAPVNYATRLTGKTKKKSATNLTISNQPNSIGFKIQLSSKN